MWKIEQKNISSPLKFILKSHISKVYTGYIWFLSKSTSYFNTYTIYSVDSLIIQRLIFLLIFLLELVIVIVIDNPDDL